ncbi:hypothetical protein [Paenibacillus woosongensis]|uniref:Uncharacterized protein n=1 Tax=Paenibacillus woosongensis TaxID=307580 RepID=A0A7X3CML2_9BACL|nr:hypothetical protein [Paenibacillus woosongensis]MUG45763.1 hypothetical protein [Paenibacillus woosongensis]
MTFALRLRKVYGLLILAAILVASFASETAMAASGHEPVQEWELDFSGTGIKIFEIYETDQGYTIIGTKNKQQAFLARLNAEGSVMWEKTLDLRTSDGNQVVVTAADYTRDGEYLLGGTVPGYDSYYYIARTDADGIILWEKEEFSRDYVEFNEIRETFDQGIIYSYNSGQSTAYMVKLDATGDDQWKNELTMTKYDPNVSIESVRPAADGGYISGAFRSGSYMLWKLSASGQSEWINYYGDGIGWAVPAPNNGYAIVNYDRWLNQSVLIIGQFNGQQLTKELGMNGTARSIESALAGGYLIGLSNAVIACDAQGNVTWSKPTSLLTKALPTHDGGAVYIASYEKVVKLTGSSGL